MKKIKNRLDEMQEQRMLKIEHNGCWLAFWGLLVMLLIQEFVYGAGNWRYMAGEWIVFMCLALYMLVDIMHCQRLLCRVLFWGNYFCFMLCRAFMLYINLQKACEAFGAGRYR